ncbi:uncharacterized protein Z519_02740 [Cladophialophora bantiana CBS 173.52]|uniref:DUF7702 domain-containing protein n=1 Tax=Cladophialophora bantiana (strain ATCC 10958 / CBS 173.52 / CDC B-1940 / NIH 8579) TaxID=1442370 RepID=A0A0D2HVG2_CLAB1|nr:uncharacterized protein Z519_02740 [Cladophialophora bantiana CBS 173.52]KIW97348.1 hypothetical protein Z519_02740 [Cladophialophora bantiana CBS 173.52]
MSNTVMLDTIEIVVYILLIPLIVILGVRHGLTHSLGYIFLCVFAVLRILADSLGIADRNSTNPNTIIMTSAMHSAGLSPLLLVLAGFAHEAHHYLVKATRSNNEAQALLTRLRALQGGFHALSTGGMGHVVYGAIKSENSQSLCS